MIALRFWILIGFFFGLGACGETESSRPHLVGGEPFAKGNTSAAVGLLFRNNGGSSPVQTTRTCAGTLLRNDIVLTAAHCLNGYAEQKLSLNFIVASDGTKIKAPAIRAVRLHPSYAASDGLLSPFNLALLKLSSPLTSGVVSSASVGFRKPSVGDSIFTIGAGCEVAEADGSCKGPHSILKYLKGLATTVVNNPEAGIDFNDTWFFSQISDGFTADGDEGGPVFAKDGTVIGINTYRKGVTQSRVPAYLWLGNPQLQAFLVDLSFDDTIPPFLVESTKLLEEIKQALEACGYDTKQHSVFDRLNAEATNRPEVRGDCPSSLGARDARIRSLLLAAAHVERAERAFEEGRFEEARELLNIAKDIFIVALQIGIDLSPLGRIKSAIECYLGREILPEYKNLEGLDYVLTCISAIGLDERILKYGIKSIASTNVGKAAIKRVETFTNSLTVADRLKKKMPKAIEKDLDRVVSDIRTRLGQETTSTEVEALADVALKMGAQQRGDFVKVADLVGDTGRLKRFLRITESLESVDTMKSKMRLVSQSSGLPSPLASTFQSYEIYEVVEPVTVIRYYDTAEAAKLGAFWSNRVYKTKQEFYEGAVVFPEWNKVERMALMRVEKGEKIALGKIRGQRIKGNGGLDKSLPDSEEYQFILPADMDSEFIKSGGEASDWLSHLRDEGRVTIIDDDITLPQNW